MPKTSYGQDSNKLTSFDSASVSTNDSSLVSDSLIIASDTVASDTIVTESDSTVKVEESRQIETTIFYNAKDTLVLDLFTQDVNMIGESNITYGNTKLEANEVGFQINTHIIKARGTPDTLGVMQGEPVFTEGGKVFYTKEMAYNFDTRKALIKGVVTEEGDANMRGDRVYKNQKDELFIADAVYTTCTAEDPHFHIQASKIKMIPNKKVVTGPFHLRIKNIPTPLWWFFGMFPMPKQNNSGLVVPQYGEERRRGFYLKNGGYYFAINDYVDAQILGEIYSKGSWGLNLGTDYRKRYSYQGNMDVRFNYQKGTLEGDSTVAKDFWINWSHTPQSKGTSRFSASVNMGTSTYNQNNPTYSDISRTLNQDFSSSVSYSKTFRGTPFNMSANARMQQNVSTGVGNLMLPQMAVNMNRVYPLKKKGASAKTWWQKTSVGWNMTANNKISNAKQSRPSFNATNYYPENDTILPFFSNLSTLFDRGQSGMKHSIPVSTSIKAFKYFTLNPSFNYQELWYLKELNYEYEREGNGVRVDTVSGFSRAYSYSTSASLNTVLYGTLNAKRRDSKIMAVRHVMTPSIGAGLSPDFSSEKYGYYQNVQIDSLGRTKRLSKYEGFIYGAPSAGRNASASFSLQNKLEMKVRDESDTAKGFKKVALLENFSLNSSYNFLADSFKLAPISISGRTKLFNKKLDVSFRSTLDPYIYELDTSYIKDNGDLFVEQRKRNIYAWSAGKGLGNISNASLALGFNLAPKKSGKAGEEASSGARSMLDQIDAKESLTAEDELLREHIENNPDMYVDFSIPWSLRVNYNLNFSKTGYQEARITQGLTLSGEVKLTEEWRISFRSGFDFEKKKITQTSMNVIRDLHCWQLNFNWVPFGRYESYNLSIHAKSTLLQDLKINRQRSWWDN